MISSKELEHCWNLEVGTVKAIATVSSSRFGTVINFHSDDPVRNEIDKEIADV